MLEEYPVTEFLVLPGHHLYTMDYQKLIMFHRDNGADITIATSVARRLHDPGFGFLNVNSENQVTDFRLNLEGKSVNVASVSTIQQILFWFLSSTNVCSYG